MSRINRPPIGLQGLLQSKNFGVNPNELSQVVQPTIDLFSFLGVWEFDSAITAEFTVAGESQFASFVVPQNEVWLVESVFVSCRWDNAPTAGDSIHYSAALDNVFGSNVATADHAIADFGVIESADAAATSSIHLAVHMPNLWPARGGETFRFQASDSNLTGAASMLARGGARFYKLDV